MSILFAVHAFSALGALLLGPFAFITYHAKKSWWPIFIIVWVSLMTVVAGSSFWIKTTGSFSVLHILSIITILSLLQSAYIYFIHKTDRWIFPLGGVYLGLAIAGGFAFLPTRTMGSFLANDPALFIVIFLVALLSLYIYSKFLIRR